MAFVAASLKRKALLRHGGGDASRKRLDAMAATSRQGNHHAHVVSPPSFPSPLCEKEAETLPPQNASTTTTVTTIDESHCSTNVTGCVSSSTSSCQERRENCSSSRARGGKHFRAPVAAERKRVRAKPSNDDVSMETQCRPRRYRRRFRRLQQYNKWLFSVGRHADKRSHGKGRSSNSSSAHRRLWSMADFDVVHELGSGGFGVVLLVEEVARNEHVALKQLSKEMIEHKSFVDHVRDEVEIQTSLHHENILECFGYFQTQQSIILVMEYGPLGNLSEYKDEFFNGKLCLDVAARCMRQVTSAVAYLDRLHVAHRDIKPENIVLVSNSEDPKAKDTIAKLCDFGYAVHAPDEEKRSTLCGTCEFCPPEMIVPPVEREYVARYVDRWALGVLAFELVIGKSPFYLSERQKRSIANANGYEETYHAVFDRIEEFSSLQPSPDCDDEDLFDFCAALMQRNPCRRLSAAEALAHPWLRHARKRTKSSRKRATLATKRRYN